MFSPAYSASLARVVPSGVGPRQGEWCDRRRATADAWRGGGGGVRKTPPPTVPPAPLGVSGLDGQECSHHAAVEDGIVAAPIGEAGANRRVAGRQELDGTAVAFEIVGPRDGPVVGPVV